MLQQETEIFEAHKLSHQERTHCVVVPSAIVVFFRWHGGTANIHFIHCKLPFPGFSWQSSIGVLTVAVS